MGKIITEITENSFSRKSASNYELSILLGMDSFVFMATNDRPDVLLLRHYTREAGLDQPHLIVKELEQLRASDANLRVRYRNARIGLTTAVQTLIPNRLYNPREKKAYLSQMTDLESSLEFRSDDLHGLALQNVYAYPREIMDFCRNAFSGCRIFHSSSAMILGLRSLAAHQEGSILFMHVWPHHLKFVLFDRGDLKFVNIFSYQHTRDLLYYLMLIFDQFDLSPEKTTVLLSGHIREKSEAYAGIRRYLQNASFLQVPPYLQFGNPFDELPPYLYYDLFSLIQFN